MTIKWVTNHYTCPKCEYDFEMETEAEDAGATADCPECHELDVAPHETIRDDQEEPDLEIPEID